MKELIFAMMLALGSLASASVVKNVICTGSKAAGVSAHFTLSGNALGPQYSVDLSVAGRSLKGMCFGAPSDESQKSVVYMKCSVLTSSDSGYEVSLFSKNGKFNQATVQPMAGRGGTIDAKKTLTVCKVQ